MNINEALKIIDDVMAVVTTTRENHKKIQEAYAVIQETCLMKRIGDDLPKMGKKDNVPS